MSVSTSIPLPRPLTMGTMQLFNEVIRAQVETYQLEPVRALVLVCELHDVPIFHKLRYDLVFLATWFYHHRCADEGENIRVVKVFPYDNLLAKPLYGMRINVNAAESQPDNRPL